MISIIIPLYNESRSIEALLSTLQKELPSNYQYELILIDDGSDDNSVKKIKENAITYPYKLIQFSRNFGKEAAVYAGLKSASGDAAIILDADLQHPIHLVHTFLAKWEEGHDMVYGVLKTRQHQNRLKSYFSKCFYQILNLLSDTPIPANAGDFRLLSRKCINAITACQEHNLFMKGLYAWVGFKTCAISYEANTRKDDTKGRWSLGALCNLAINGLTNFSSAPLRLVTITGVFISVFAFIYGAWIILSTYIYGKITPGFATIMVVILFLGGLQLLAVGIVGEYIAKIFNEVKKRPHYIIDTIYEKK